MLARTTYISAIFPQDGCRVWPDVLVCYSESDYKKPICKVRVQCTRSLASEYKLDTEPASRLHLEHYIGDEDISETD